MKSLSLLWLAIVGLGSWVVPAAANSGYVQTCINNMLQAPNSNPGNNCWKLYANCRQLDGGYSDYTPVNLGYCFGNDGGRLGKRSLERLFRHAHVLTCVCRVQSQDKGKHSPHINKSRQCSLQPVEPLESLVGTLELTKAESSPPTAVRN
jgi:hypothetical protein